MIGERRGLILYLLSIEPSLLQIVLAGILGGVAMAIYALKNGRYQNNKHFEKILVESIGGLIISGVMMSIFFTPFKTSSLIIAFAVGLVWGVIAQAIRASITRHVVEILKDGIWSKIIHSNLRKLHSIGFTNLSDEQIREYGSRYDE